MKKLVFSIYVLLVISFNLNGQELVIGEERVEPGVVFVFEGAIKDKIMPMSMHLNENQTNVHIEARVNWDINEYTFWFSKRWICPLFTYYCQK